MLNIIQNDPEVPPGNLLDQLNVPYRVHHLYLGEPLPEIGGTSAVIVLGGAMGANDDARHPFLTVLKRFIREVVASGIPYLGICLGGQLLAAALGADVHSVRWEEQGTLSVKLTSSGKVDPLFRGIADEFPTFQWHHDSFDIPEKGVLLALSVACPHQAFRVGTRAWGVQFHPEVTESIVRDWCACDNTTAAQTEDLVTAFADREAEYRQIARSLRGNFLRVVGLI